MAPGRHLGDARTRPRRRADGTRAAGVRPSVGHPRGCGMVRRRVARREEDERLQLERAAHEREADAQPDRDPAPEISLVDASVEDAVIGGTPTNLGLEPSFVEYQRVAEAARLDLEPVRPEVPEPVPPPVVLPPEPAPRPAVRHPHVPRPPAPDPVPQPKRRRRHRREPAAPTTSFVISAPEWARMSPGARRLYGLDAPPPA
jgi:hypothetical protein